MVVTKKIFLPAARSISSVAGTPSMAVALQIAPVAVKDEDVGLVEESDRTVSLVQRPFACELDEIERVSQL